MSQPKPERAEYVWTGDPDDPKKTAWFYDYEPRFKAAPHGEWVRIDLWLAESQNTTREGDQS